MIYIETVFYILSGIFVLYFVVMGFFLNNCEW